MRLKSEDILANESIIFCEEYKPNDIVYGFFKKNIFLKKGYVESDVKLIAQKYLVAEDIAIVTQKHTKEVAIIKKFSDSKIIADAQITNQINLPLAVLTADCVPIIFIDEENKIIGTAHAGWRGARYDIISATIEAMNKEGADKITAIIGPCIKQRSYEVDNEFYEGFLREKPENEIFFIPSVNEKHFMFDLTSYVKMKLKLAGVMKVFDIDRNTYEEEECFYSYRRKTHKPECEMNSLISFVKIIA